MVWRYCGEGATHKMWYGSMQRFLRNLSLRTTDACAMTVALLMLLTKSSRAEKSSRAKNVPKIPEINRNILKVTLDRFYSIPYPFSYKHSQHSHWKYV